MAFSVFKPSFILSLYDCEVTHLQSPQALNLEFSIVETRCAPSAPSFSFGKVSRRKINEIVNDHLTPSTIYSDP